MKIPQVPALPGMTPLGFKPASKLREDRLYSGDNGRQFCGAHAGATAKATGRDISGQRVVEVTAQDCEVARRIHDVAFACETCGFKPGLVVLTDPRKDG